MQATEETALESKGWTRGPGGWFDPLGCEMRPLSAVEALVVQQGRNRAVKEALAAERAAMLPSPVAPGAVPEALEQAVEFALSGEAIESVLGALIEVGNGVTDEMLHASADVLLAVRDRLRASLAARRIAAAGGGKGERLAVGAAIAEWMLAAVRGEDVSDFGESFPAVREAMDLRRDRDETKLLLDSAVKAGELAQQIAAVDTTVRAQDGSESAVALPTPLQLVAAMVANIKDLLDEAGPAALNYVEQRFVDKVTGAVYPVILVRPGGKTPHELQRAAEAERDALRAGAERRVAELEEAVGAARDLGKSEGIDAATRAARAVAAEYLAKHGGGGDYCLGIGAAIERIEALTKGA